MFRRKPPQSIAAALSDEDRAAERHRELAR
jgi:hypothetical protein